MQRRVLSGLLLVGTVSCAGAPVPPVGSIPPPRTEAVLAGHRCTKEACTCRDLGKGQDWAEEQPPPAGLRRYELRLRALQGPAWVVFNERDVLYRATGPLETCFYLDLPVGGHAVRLVTEARDQRYGAGAALRISEYAQGELPDRTVEPRWYETFTFQCGAPGPCDAQVLTEWSKTASASRHHRQDQCGATQILSPSWSTGPAPEEHPTSFAVRFTLRPQPKSPVWAPGDARCGEAQE